MSAPAPGVEAFTQRIAILAPHMDDETLGCGVLLAKHARKEQVHVLFVTDGARSPEAPVASQRAPQAVAAIRAREALDAMAVFGIPAANVEFLRFPDGTLERHAAHLRAVLVERLRTLRPASVFVPFRYDCHPDHLAVNRAVCDALREGQIDVTVVEYFVYSQWRLLRAGDVRAYLSPGDLVRLQDGQAAAAKRRALECYRSQTARYFDWQARPILTRQLLERVCAEAEIFLRYDPARPGRQALARGRSWIPLAHRVEPLLKRWKDRLAGGVAA